MQHVSQVNPFSRRGLIGALAGLVLVLAAACETATPVAPSTPVIVDSAGSGSALSCPANIELLSTDGSPRPVTFGMPTLPGVGATEKSSCSPVSGSVFPVGTTTVTCRTTEGSMASSCTFQVSVRVPPPPPPPPSVALRETRFLAFGDSITDGFIPSLDGIFSAPLRSAVSYDGYPMLVLQMIQRQYPHQSFLMSIAGLGGETTSAGLRRLPGELARFNPGALIILEGVNELRIVTPSQADSDLREMVRTAQREGIEVFILTLTPIGDRKERDRPGVRDAVAELNRRIRQLARDLGIAPAVDVHRAFGNDTSLLHADGLHPSAAGHRVIAQEVYEAVRSRLEIDLPTVAPSSDLAIELTLNQ